MPISIVLITNAIAPYRIPLFNHLSHLLDQDIEVLFLSVREAERQWLVDESAISFRYEVLGSDISVHNLAAANTLARSIFSYLRVNKPKVIVVGGYDNIAVWSAWMYRQLHDDSKLVLWTGTHKHSVERKDIIATLLKRVFVRGCDSFVTYGQWATDYLKSVGVSEQRIVTACNVGDIDFFVKTVDQIRFSPEFQLERSRYAKSILFASGQLIPRKGFVELLSALGRIQCDDWELWLAGSGYLENHLRGMAANFGDKVRFMGFLHRQDLARGYAMADIGVVPSTTEVGSIVLSEYLASGLFTIGSKYDASAHNLLISANEGRIVDPLDVASLAEAVETAIHKHAQGHIDRHLVRQALKGKDIRHYAESIHRATILASQLHNG